MITDPGINVISSDTDEVFNWYSDGWYSQDVRYSDESKELMAIAQAIIREAPNVLSAITRLEEAGFRVRRVLP